MKRHEEEPPCGVACPVRRAAQVLDGKWTTLILRDLQGGKKRFSELQRSLEGISPRLLTARLRMLEMQGVLTRTVFATVPPTTEYALTASGQQIMPILQAMATYGQALLRQDACADRSVKAVQIKLGVTKVRGGKRLK